MPPMKEEHQSRSHETVTQNQKQKLDQLMQQAKQKKAAGKKLVHIVATLNLDEASGRILYVNPTSTEATPTGEAGASAFEAVPHPVATLVARDDNGNDLLRIPAGVRLNACRDASDPRLGLVQEYVNVPSATHSIELLLDGKVVDTFVAGSARAPARPEVELVPRSDDAMRSRPFSAVERAVPVGTSYLIQVRPDNDTTWSTLAIGQVRPQFTIDKNQFPGAVTLDVRVISSTGLSQEVIDTRTIDLTELPDK